MNFFLIPKSQRVLKINWRKKYRAPLINPNSATMCNKRLLDSFLINYYYIYVHDWRTYYAHLVHNKSNISHLFRFRRISEFGLIQSEFHPLGCVYTKHLSQRIVDFSYIITLQRHWHWSNLILIRNPPWIVQQLVWWGACVS